MHFIGQIDFAEVVAAAPSFADRLPEQGLVRREAPRNGDLSEPWLDLQCF